MFIISRLLLCLIPLFVSACESSSTKQAEVSVKKSVASVQKNIVIPNKESKMIKIDKSWQQVTVKYFALEGGFYGLVSDKGAKLLPMNLPSKYKVAGSILRVKGRSINGMVTVQQWGNPFEVSDIELIEMGAGNLPTH